MQFIHNTDFRSVTDGHNDVSIHNMIRSRLISNLSCLENDSQFIDVYVDIWIGWI